MNRKNILIKNIFFMYTNIVQCEGIISTFYSFLLNFMKAFSLLRAYHLMRIINYHIQGI